MSDKPRDPEGTPVDDGSDKPVGYLTEDGELIVRESRNADGTVFRGYHETNLGQERRWQRQAGDLYANWMSLVEKHLELGRTTSERIDDLAAEIFLLKKQHEAERSAWAQRHQEAQSEIDILRGELAGAASVTGEILAVLQGLRGE